MVTLMALTNSAHPSVPAHEYYGNTELHASSHSDEPVKEAPKRVFTANVSAYTKAFDETNRGDGVTASGRLGIPWYTCAADDLPIGTKVKINGRIWEVMDRFGGGYTGRIDLMMDTKAECYEFGRRNLEVEVIE